MRRRSTSRWSPITSHSVQAKYEWLKPPGWYRNYPALRIYPVNHPWEGDDFADVLCATDPSHGALQAQAEAGVRDAAVAAQVQIPLEGLYRQVVLFQSLNKQVIVVDA